MICNYEKSFALDSLKDDCCKELIRMFDLHGFHTLSCLKDVIS